MFVSLFGYGEVVTCLFQLHSIKLCVCLVLLVISKFLLSNLFPIGMAFWPDGLQEDEFEIGE